MHPVRLGTIVRTLIPAAVALLPASAPAAAEPATGSVALPPVVVTAEAPEDGASAAGPVPPTTGIDRSRMDAMPATRLGDVLKALPGVSMGGQPGENKDVRLRGMDKEFTRTQIGGATLSDGGEKREFQVHRFPSMLAGEVTVLRNPTAEYESDGIAGRILVDFRDIPQERRIEYEGAIGRRGKVDDAASGRLQALYGETFGPLGVQGAFSWIADPFAKDKLKQEVGGKSETEDELKRTAYTDLFMDFGWTGQAHSLSLRPMVLAIDEGKEKLKRTFLANGALEKSEIEQGEEDRRTLALIAGHDWKPGHGLAVESLLALSRTTELKDLDRTFLLVDGSLDKTEDEVEDKLDQSLELRSKIGGRLAGAPSHDLSAGLAVRGRERIRDKTKLETKNGVVTDKTVDKDNYQLDELYMAGFVQDSMALSDTLTLIPGLRYEHVLQRARSGAGAIGTASIPDLLPSLHAAWHPADALTFHAAVSRQVNRPKFDELAPFQQISGNQIVEGNPALEPARSWSFDIGGQVERPDLFLGVNLFHREVTGVIETVDTGTDVGARDLLLTENVGDGYVQGIELEQRFSLSHMLDALPDGLVLETNQTFIRSELEDSAGNRRRFKEQPAFIGNVSLVWRQPGSGTTVSLGGTYVSGIAKDEATKTDRTAGEFFLDLHAETRIAGAFSAFLQATNLTGEAREKRIVDGNKVTVEREATGRLFLIGLKARF